MAQFAGSADWAEPLPLFAHRARPTLLKCKNDYQVLPMGEETAVQAVVGSIVWAFYHERVGEDIQGRFYELSRLYRHFDGDRFKSCIVRGLQ